MPPSKSLNQQGKPRRRRVPVEHYDRVSTMLISMVPYALIEKQLAAEWSRSKDYVRGVIRQVHEDWAATAATVADTRRHQVRQGFEQVFMRCMARQGGPDLSNAVRVLRELGLLDGCYQPQGVQVQVQHSGAVGHVGISLGSLGFRSPEEVQARIDELRARIAAEGPGAVQGAQPLAVAVHALAGQATPSQADRAVIDVEPPADDVGGSPT